MDHTSDPKSTTWVTLYGYHAWVAGYFQLFILIMWAILKYLVKGLMTVCLLRDVLIEVTCYKTKCSQTICYKLMARKINKNIWKGVLLHGMHVSFHKLVLHKIMIYNFFIWRLVSLASRIRFYKFWRFFNQALRILLDLDSKISFLIINSMEKILDRYERYSYAERQLTAPDPESQVCPNISLASYRLS